MRPTQANRRLRYLDEGFTTLVDALEYAAGGETGYNFYDSRGEPFAVLPYAQLLREARLLARRIRTVGGERGSRVAIVADSEPMFVRFFFACQYAGYLPVALPADVAMGGRDAYVQQLRSLIEACGATIVVAPHSHAQFLEDASAGLDTMAGTPDIFDAIAPSDEALTPLAADEAAYLQYTSGSTQFPRGVEVSQHSVMTNLREIAQHGLKLGPDDRFVSWLPLFHDMGLVGFVLLPLAAQLSVDLLSPRSFAMRPRLWLKLLSENGGTVTSSPPFGYDLASRRVRGSDAEKYDLRRLRAACVGAERINTEPLDRFAKALEAAGFDPKAFVACYGMAECVLAISFAPIDRGLCVDTVDRQEMVETLHARRVTSGSVVRTLDLVDCGVTLPSYELSIQDDAGNGLADRQCGRIVVRGPSVTTGYFQNEDATREALSDAGWFDTGDIGYTIGESVVVTARRKDVIIINGRNIWPQDLEQLAESVPNPGVRHVSAFAATTTTGDEVAVLVVEARTMDEQSSRDLVKIVQAIIRAHFAINVYVDVVPRGTLPRTSSGKLSRLKAKGDFLSRSEEFVADASVWIAREAHG
jgi:fatty-acyl-CoA synthase